MVSKLVRTLLASTTVALVALVALVACAEAPVFPFAAVPTLDDAGPAPDGFVQVAVGPEHTCALLADNRAVCWGSNEGGQLGRSGVSAECVRLDRRIPCEPSPRFVSGGRTFSRVVAGALHSCGLALDGFVWCWGDNGFGQLGDPSVIQTTSPVLVVGGTTFVDLVAGDRHNCALRVDGVAMCWGANDYGQIGSGLTGAGSITPVAVTSTMRFTALAAGMRRTCARGVDGSTWCWGSFWVARGVDGSELERTQTTPQRVIPTPEFQALTVGGHTTCGLGVGGDARCWEANSLGTIGDRTTLGSLSPLAVRTGERFIQLAAGGSQTCGLADTGLVYCWGAGGSGQLGVPASSLQLRCRDLPCNTSPVRVTGWRTYTRLNVGLGDHVCAVTTATNLYCWGAGSMGQRGDGTAASTWSPTRVRAPRV